MRAESETGKGQPPAPSAPEAQVFCQCRDRPSGCLYVSSTLGASSSGRARTSTHTQLRWGSYLALPLAKNFAHACRHLPKRFYDICGMCGVCARRGGGGGVSDFLFLKSGVQFCVIWFMIFICVHVFACARPCVCVHWLHNDAKWHEQNYTDTIIPVFQPGGRPVCACGWALCVSRPPTVAIAAGRQSEAGVTPLALHSCHCTSAPY